MNRSLANYFSKFALLPFVLAVLSASGQTNQSPPASQTNGGSISAARPAEGQANEGLALALHIEDIRAECIQNRRIICGKIIKVLPDGLVVDSGYTNLVRAALNGTWLIPGTTVATRATNVVESSQPDAICIGFVFLTDLPKSQGAKPKLFDYVNIEGFPMGQYTYTSVGDLKRTVRKFTTKIANAVRWNFEESVKTNAPPQ